jgi:hypothetical protein
MRQDCKMQYIEALEERRINGSGARLGCGYRKQTRLIIAALPLICW